MKMNTATYRLLTWLTVFAVFMVIQACSKDSSRVGEGVVATVGSFEISDVHFQNQLRRFYLRTGRAANLNEDVRLAVVNARIERYAIVEHAREIGWASDADAMYNKAMIERKVYMEEYERRFIHARVSITEDDLREVFRRYHSSVRASHLYAANRAAADSLYMLLQQGQRFEDLARRTFSDVALASSGGDLGYFTLDEMDPSFEEQVFSMRVGEISAPVRTSTGYSIIKVTDIITNPLITEFQFAQRRQAVEQVARNQRFELATRHDMDRVVAQLQWDEALVRQLWAMLQENPGVYGVVRPELAEIPLPVDDQLRSRTLAQWGAYRFTVQDFLTEAYYTPVARRSMARDFYAFEEQVHGLAYRSYALGLVRTLNDLDRDFIRGSIDETFYGYLFERFEDSIAEQVRVTPREIEQAFRANPAMFEAPLQLNMAEMVFTNKDLADQVYKQLESGADFDAMLKQYGAETSSKAEGGVLGYMPVDRFGVMATGVRNVQPGQVVGPFQVAANHFIIFKCLGRMDPRPLSLEEASSKVHEFVQTRKRQVLRDGIIKELRTRYNAHVDMNRLNSLSIEL